MSSWAGAGPAALHKRMNPNASEFYPDESLVNPASPPPPPSGGTSGGSHGRYGQGGQGGTGRYVGEQLKTPPFLQQYHGNWAPRMKGGWPGDAYGQSVMPPVDDAGWSGDLLVPPLDAASTAAADWHAASSQSFGPEFRRGRSTGKPRNGQGSKSSGDEIVDDTQASLGYAAVWNLNPTYSATDLKHDLSELDFHAEKVLEIAEVCGAFALFFQHDYTAAAAAVALDETQQGYLKDGGEPLRCAQWKNNKQTWSSDDVPDEIQNSWTSIMNRFFSGGDMT